MATCSDETAEKNNKNPTARNGEVGIMPAKGANTGPEGISARGAEKGKFRFYQNTFDRGNFDKT